MPDVQVQLDEISTLVKTELKDLATKSETAYDEMRNNIDSQNTLSVKAREESVATVTKLQADLTKYEERQDLLTKQLEDMHKAVTRAGSGGGGENSFTRKASNIISLEDYHKSMAKAEGRSVDAYLTREKSDDEIKYEQNFFEDMAAKNSSGYKALQDKLIETKSLIVSDLTSMGYYVPATVQGRIITKMFESSPMLQHAEVTALASGNDLEHIVDRAQFTFQLLDEVTTPSDSDVAELQQLTVTAQEAVTKVPVSRRTMQDSGIDTSSYVAGKAGDRMGRGFNNLYVNGVGGTQPYGIITTPIATTADDTRAFGTLQNFVTANATGFDTDTPDALVNMVVSIKANYEANAKFFMNKFTLGEVRKLKDGDGNYLWQPDFTKLASSTLLGYPLVRFEDMPNLAASSRSILFGDMRQAYHVINRLGVMSVLDDVSQDRFVVFKFFQRSGGRPTDSEAMRVMVTSA